MKRVRKLSGNDHFALFGKSVTGVENSECTNVDAGT
jgi:hypothetical protein